MFFAIKPKPAILNDKNAELMALYRGIRYSPSAVWQHFSEYPSDKEGYYRIRSTDTRGWSITAKAARALYLNRTCFKGMWRQNSRGEFNIGYGGESRRWVITEADLKDVARVLRGTTLSCADFQDVIEDSKAGDLMFVDPPYHPGRRESPVEHYMFSQFTFESHMRLAATLKAATRRGVWWALTTSSHPDILSLYSRHRTIPFRTGVGESPGRISRESGEALVLNY